MSKWTKNLAGGAQVTVSLAGSDIEIGAVELKDGTTDTRGVVAAGTAVTEAGNAVAVKDFGIGFTTDVAVVADVNGTVSAKLRGLVKILADVYVSASHWLAVQLQPSENYVGSAGGTTVTVADTFARPADTTAYTAGDAVAAATTDTGTTGLRALANIARVAAGSGYLVGLRLWTDQVANVAQFRVHFYKVAAPATAVPGDNAQMTLAFANFLQRIGHVDLIAMATSTVATSSTAAQALDLTLRIPFACAAGSRALYYRLETLSGFTPASAQNFSLEVSAEVN